MSEAPEPRRGWAARIVPGRALVVLACVCAVVAAAWLAGRAAERWALADLRRGVMELYISDHPLDCLTCAANGNCELQDMAGVVGLREVRYGYEGENHLNAPKDTSNPYFTFDPSKCIVCSRCVRACEEVQGTFALTIDGRGFASMVSASENQPFMESECVSCGACVQACPTPSASRIRSRSSRGRCASAGTTAARGPTPCRRRT